MKEMQCRNIIKLKELFETEECYFIVMEYCCEGDVKSWKQKNANSVFTLKQASEILLDLVNGLEKMHEGGFIHRDLKIDNIFVQTNQIGNKVLFLFTKVFKIGDFGLSTADVVSSQVVGSPCYMSPEILKLGGYGNEVDIWALGVIFYFLLTGDYPFSKFFIQLRSVTIFGRYGNVFQKFESCCGELQL